MGHKDILLLVNVTATDAVYPTLIQYAKEHGWRLTIEDRMSPPAGWHGDGAIMQAMDIPVITNYVKSLRRRGIPVVNLVNSRISRSIPSCLIDVATVGRLAAAHFKERGFTHTAFFSMEWMYGREMQFSGFTTAWDNGNVRKWIWPEAAEAKTVNNQAAMVKWIRTTLADAPKPVATLCANSYNAVTLLNACLDMGLSVPDEVAILSANYDPAFCDCQAVPISGAEIDSRRQAKEAAALLDRLIDRQRAVRPPTGAAPVVGQSPRDRRDGRRYDSTHIVIPPTRIVIQRSTDVLATENPILRQSFQFIRENLSRPFGAAEIATHLAIPRIRLDRLFALELKRSAGAEIMRQRIARAKQMLLESDATLAAIAADTGFCHASYLISSFKKAVGTTPRRYRIMNARPTAG